MFTGIVTDIGRVRSVRQTVRDRRYEIETAWNTAGIDLGASISHAGCCLTVTEKGYCHDPATGKLNPAHPDIVHDRAQPAHDHAGALALGEVHEQRIEADDLDVAFDPRRFAHHHRHALLDGEHRVLRRIGGHADDQPVDQLGAAADDVDMAQRDRIESAGIDADLAHQCFLSTI